jgi:hypothetical protein
MTDNKPWWWPVRMDAEWFARLRSNYPEKVEWSDEELQDYFGEGWDKFTDTWDHLGDARAEYEHLAEAFLKLVEAHGLKPEDFNDD